MCRRLPEQVLSDICVARQLYSNAVVSISHNRRMLFMQLQQLLDRYTYIEKYNIDSVITELHGELYVERYWCGNGIQSFRWSTLPVAGSLGWKLCRCRVLAVKASILKQQEPNLPQICSLMLSHPRRALANSAAPAATPGPAGPLNRGHIKSGAKIAGKDAAYVLHSSIDKPLHL